MLIWICLAAFFACGCASTRSTATDATPPEQPSWFALGGEVYHEQDRFELHKQVLEFVGQPRWFLAIPKRVNKEEFEALLESEKTKTEFEPPGPNHQCFSSPDTDGKYLIDIRMPYPKNIEEIPLVDQGASLRLEITETKTPSVMRFKLTLKASERTVCRELEHRCTNITPFLFAFFADGKPVSRPWGDFGKFGGTNGLVELVEKGQEYTWDLKVDTKSIDALLPDTPVRSLQIVACFSERQHQTGFMGLDIHFGTERHTGPQILVRSNTVCLEKAADGWIPDK